nr:MAG TPA: hypothetical protein [Caudoviricetes sp.]
MSKAVLISIRPKWCEKIANGEKTIELRKTRPKLNPPFKCYIYCTKDPAKQFWTGPRYSYADDHSHNAFDRRGDGKVIGEFTCDQIYELETKAPGGSYYVKGVDQPTTNDVARQSCLDLRDMHEYLRAAKGYGWHISDLKIYDTPRALSDFRRACKNDWWCESCAMYSEYSGRCGNASLQISRPPQSWCYVEELK